MAGRLAFSVSAIATLTRMVWFFISIASRARATILIFFSCCSRSANGGVAQPMSIWPVMTLVSVPGGPPVAVGFAFEPACLSNVRRIRFDDEPGDENAMVLFSPASLRLWLLRRGFTYQIGRAH